MARATSPKRVTHAKTVLIVVEGQKTETFYFERLKRALKLEDRVDVQFSGYTDPENIVSVAADELRAHQFVLARERIEEQVTRGPQIHPSLGGV